MVKTSSNICLKKCFKVQSLILDSNEDVKWWKQVHTFGNVWRSKIWYWMFNEDVKWSKQVQTCLKKCLRVQSLILDV